MPLALTDAGGTNILIDRPIAVRGTPRVHW